MASETRATETTHPRFHLPLSPRAIPRERHITSPKFGGTIDGEFFQQLIALQDENALLKKQCIELNDSLQRRQASYLRRETKLEHRISHLEAQNRAFWEQHCFDDTQYAQSLKRELEDGLEALLSKQKLQLAMSHIDRLETIDEKLKIMESEFQCKTDRLNDSDTDRKFQNERAMNAVEELSGLRNCHIALQQKYKDECSKTRELRTQLECSRETEEILIKCVKLNHSCAIQLRFRRLRSLMKDERGGL